MNKKMFFDEQAKNWDNFIGKDLLRKIKYKILPKLKIKNLDKVIDIGCGTGIMLPFLLEKLGCEGKLVALDYSKKMLEIAKKKFGKKCDYICCDAHNIKLDGEMFDVAICFNVFPHFDNKNKVVEEIFRILKPEGKFYIAHSDSIKNIMKLHKKTHKVIMNDKMLTDEKIKCICKKAGFKNIKIANNRDYYLLSATKR